MLENVITSGMPTSDSVPQARLRRVQVFLTRLDNRQKKVLLQLHPNAKTWIPAMGRRLESRGVSLLVQHLLNWDPLAAGVILLVFSPQRWVTKRWRALVPEEANDKQRNVLLRKLLRADSAFASRETKRRRSTFEENAAEKHKYAELKRARRKR